MPPAGPDTACVIMHPAQMPAAGRKSPLDSVTFSVGGSPVKICYGRPSLRGRVMLGGEAVPFDTLWRTGANEPTTVYSPIALDVAGVVAPAGSWTLYTVPGETEWQIIVNKSTTQWGEEHNYTGQVRAQEVGRGRVKPEALRAPIEMFTIRAEPAADGGATLILEWQRTRVAIPIKPAG
jgi:hypothetical protein